MRKFILSSSLIVLTLSGCNREPVVFGMSQTQWYSLPPAQQILVVESYNRQQEIRQRQVPINNLIGTVDHAVTHLSVKPRDRVYHTEYVNVSQPPHVVQPHPVYIHTASNTASQQTHVYNNINKTVHQNHTSSAVNNAPASVTPVYSPTPATPARKNTASIATQTDWDDSQDDTDSEHDKGTQTNSPVRNSNTMGVNTPSNPNSDENKNQSSDKSVPNPLPDSPTESSVSREPTESEQALLMIKSGYKPSEMKAALKEMKNNSVDLDTALSSLDLKQPAQEMNDSAPLHHEPASQPALQSTLPDNISHQPQALESSKIDAESSYPSPMSNDSAESIPEIKRPQENLSVQNSYDNMISVNNSSNLNSVNDRNQSSGKIDAESSYPSPVSNDSVESKPEIKGPPPLTNFTNDPRYESAKEAATSTKIKAVSGESESVLAEN